MNEKERFDIYVPGEVRNTLESDAMLFECFKDDRRTVNMNRFLTAVILGYFDSYTAEQLDALERISADLEDLIPDKTRRHETAEKIRDHIMFPESAGGRKEKKERISLKPTIAIQEIIRSIPETELPDASVSRYFCNLFCSYSRKAVHQREKVVFSENVQFLEEACRKGWNLELFTTLREEPYKVIPYRIAAGKEELFNYLLCAETGADGSQAARTFRINRIRRAVKTGSLRQIDANVKGNLERMLRSSPLYAINNDPPIRIRMTERGRQLYRNIYFGRPPCSGITPDENGEIHRFDCSVVQAFYYFRRFDQDAIEVIGPPELKSMMRDFFRKAAGPWELNKP